MEIRCGSVSGPAIGDQKAIGCSRKKGPGAVVRSEAISWPTDVTVV